MRRFLSIVCLAVLAVALLPHFGKAQEKPTGVRGEFLNEISYYEQRYTHLAEAVPADKYTWRPGEGVRSIGEVYMHIAAANYNLAKLLGTPVPDGIDPKSFLASAGDKSKTLQTLKDSFAHFRNAVLAINDADLNNSIKFFGQDTTIRGTFILLTGHFGEHLGQSIAYARMNAIVPPWTEERLKQEAAKPKP
jgi:uncharacterized damage-inducible protein DinB